MQKQTHILGYEWKQTKYQVTAKKIDKMTIF